ncbi:hypothetical protein CNMCM5623_003128 [Aspergillus felis]|uniref:Uncharacterized protein n=1 Tax=Aspergillus felis TaxID=1287682 RepID=A0A8H6UJ36_9EURO|nr:hypothetical protein CNMCM5623_003128 [Aspergillus felis]
MFNDRTLSGPEEKFPHPPQPSAPVGDLDEDDTDEEDETGATRVVREEDISILRNHVQKQTKEISFQKDIIAQVRDELQKQEEHTRRALTKVENKDVVLLKQELRKHQQANKASQKALREISGILTQEIDIDIIAGSSGDRPAIVVLYGFDPRPGSKNEEEEE